MSFADLLISLKEALQRMEYVWREIRGGVAIDFDDGCDAMFITESAMDSLPSEENPAETAKAILEEFQRLNRRRTQVLIGLRHYAVERNAAIQRSADGAWSVCSGGAEGQFEVGAPLTDMARHNEPAEVLRLLIKRSGMLRMPSPMRAGRLVSYASPPDAEHSWDEIDEQEQTISPQALAIDCSVLDSGDVELVSADELREALTPHKDDPGIKVIELMVERLGRKRFSIDLCAQGAGDFDFTDDLATYRIHPRGRRMRRLIEEHGIDGAARELTAEFRRIDRARTRCLGAIETILHRAGFHCELKYCEGGWAFGRTHREFFFDPLDGLTEKLKSADEAEVLMRWLRSTGAVQPLPSPEELRAFLDGPYEKIACQSLPAQPLSEGPSIPPLDALDINALNRCADELIAELRGHVESRQLLPGGDEPLWLWQNRLWYRRGVDSWADEVWWVERARIRWRIDQDQSAALILLANGDAEPVEGVLKRFRELGYYHEEACDDGIVWLLKDRLPWDLEKHDGMPEYPPVLGPLPSDLSRPHAMAIRQALTDFETAPGDDEDRWEFAEATFHHARRLDIQSAREWLDSSDLSRIHDACVEWAARTDDFDALDEDDFLDVAANFGWSDVVDTLESNPVLFQAVMNDEYGPPDLTSFALRLSLAKPGALAARFAAHIISLDPKEAAASAIPQEGNFKKSNLARSILKNWTATFKKGRMAGAIAWHRCRTAGAIPS